MVTITTNIKKIIQNYRGIPTKSRKSAVFACIYLADLQKHQELQGKTQSQRALTLPWPAFVCTCMMI